MAESQQTYTFTVPLDLDLIARTDIAERVIDFIVKRTQSGKGINNQRFSKYSESYTSSKDFAIAGKSGVVNLSQTGDMLTDIELLDASITGFITIGYQPGTEENDKAAWQRNNLSPGFPKRDFLGISQKDLDSIIRVYRAETPQTRESDRVASSEARNILNSLIGNLFNG